jgi:hypothetical protein
VGGLLESVFVGREGKYIWMRSMGLNDGVGTGAVIGMGWRLGVKMEPLMRTNINADTMRYEF